MGALSYDSGFKVLARIPDTGPNIQLEWLMKLGLDDGSLVNEVEMPDRERDPRIRQVRL